MKGGFCSAFLFARSFQPYSPSFRLIPFSSYTFPIIVRWVNDSTWAKELITGSWQIGNEAVDYFVLVKAEYQGRETITRFALPWSTNSGSVALIKTAFPLDNCMHLFIVGSPSRHKRIAGRSGCFQVSTPFR